MCKTTSVILGSMKHKKHKQQKHNRKLSGKMVAIGEMPLWFYLPLHSEAALSNEDIDVLVTWSKVKQ